MLPIKTIVQPTDFSQPSEFAFRIAAALAHDYGAELWIVHVAPHPSALFAEGMILATAEEIDEELDKYVARWHVPNDLQVQHRLLRGQPVDEILEIAHELHADLIVMGTHGRRGLSRLLMGSVAEQVLRKATCPVLTVKHPVPLETLHPSADLVGAAAPTHQMDGI